MPGRVAFAPVWKRARLPAAIFVCSAVVYSLFLGGRAFSPSADNHYVHLAHSFLSGQLGVVGNVPPGMNDWACYDTQEHGPCPANQFRFPASQAERYRWYVSFPALPAVLIMPLVAIGGLDVPDRLFWAILAGLGPALLFLLLRTLRERGRSERSLRDDLLLTTLFAFGTVFFFTAVQGTVWFAAHVVAVPLVALFAMWSLDARRPALAGLALALAFMARPTTMFLAPLFVLEAMQASRPTDLPSLDEAASIWRRLAHFLRTTRYRETVRPLALFALPILVVGAVAMWMNAARFENPLEFGHSYLQIFWRPRIEKWGLVNFHYFGKNLAVFVAALPWLSAVPPYLKISRHGLALWVTTPNLLLSLWPKRTSTTLVALYVSVIVVAILDLCYQNSGWVQFGYRFSLDYMIPLFAVMALGGRRFGPGFILLMVFSIAINAFGAVTFDRAWQFYDGDPTQNIIFHPD